MNELKNNCVRVTGTGSFLPGSPIPIDDVDFFLGELTEAPKKIRVWLQRMKLIMKEMVEVDNYYYAIDPVTREFTEDNVGNENKRKVLLPVDKTERGKSFCINFCSN